MWVPIGMIISNGLPTIASQQMIFVERPALPYLAPPRVKIHKMAPWEQPPPSFGVKVPRSPD